MKRHVLVALVMLSVTPGGAAAQMMGGMMGPEMMGPEMMGPMMSPMVGGMMPSKAHSCMMMAEGMMRGEVDPVRMKKALALSDEQEERLRSGLRPFQKEVIRSLASWKVAELELADLLADAKVDFGKVEAKLKEIEATRTKVRLVHLKAAEVVKSVLSKEQLEKLQEEDGSSPTAEPEEPASPQQGASPGSEAGHEQHH